MSTGIEILILAPLLLPALASGGAAAAISSAATSMASGSAAAGGVTVSGSSVVTTGAYAAGTTATKAVAVSGTAMAGSVVLVAGAAGAALLAAQNLQSSYDAALQEYQKRLDAERAENEAARHAGDAALSRARKTRVRAAESAELAFVRAGAQRLQRRLSGWSDVDPRLPGGCARLLEEIAQPAPNLPALLAAYQKLSGLVAQHAARRRESLAQAGSTPDTESALRHEIGNEVAAMRAEIAAATSRVLSDETRAELERAIARVAGLMAAQPRMAEQSLEMVQSRVGREVAAGMAREAARHAAHEKSAARLRALAGRVSARCQATQAVLENEELAASPLARAPVAALQAQAMAQLQRLAALLAGELPDDLAPLEKLAREADALFEDAKAQLQQLAQQIYLEEQVAEVFMELGYQVTKSSDAEDGSTPILAGIGEGRGVEVRLDGAGHLQSEMVALSPSATEVEAHAQDKVCALMDEVFESLRARGCSVREQKRRHYKKGAHRLRVVKTPQKTSAPIAAEAPVARRLDA